MSMLYFMLSLVEHEKNLLTSSLVLLGEKDNDEGFKSRGAKRCLTYKTNAKVKIYTVMHLT